MTHFVTVATGSTDQAMALTESFALLGAHCLNLGEGKAYPAHGTKVVLLREYLAALAESDIVCYIDAFDVVLLRDLEDFENAFRHIGSAIVFYGESYFTYKRNWLRRRIARRKLPSNAVQTEYRFLNAGCFVGYAAALRKFLHALPVDAQTPCDQTPMVDYWIQHSDELTLDYNHLLFTGTGGREGFEAQDFVFAGGMVNNALTGTLPFFAHFPGKNWVGMNRFLESWNVLRHRRPVTAEDQRRYQSDFASSRKRMMKTRSFGIEK